MRDFAMSLPSRIIEPVIAVNRPLTFENVHVLEFKFGHGMNRVDFPSADSGLRGRCR